MEMWTPEHGGITTAEQQAEMLAQQERDDAARLARSLELTGLDVDAAINGYLDAKLWTDTDELYPDADNDLPAEIDGIDRSEHGEMLDHFYSVDDIDAALVAEVRSDIENIVAAHPLAVRMYLSKRTSSDFGHDFLLTRDGNGAGFWDRGLGDLGDYLTEQCKPYGDSGSLSDGALCSDPAGIRTFEPGKLYD